MLWIRKQNNHGKQGQKSARALCSRTSAVLLAAVTAMAPLAVYGTLAETAAAVETAETAETAAAAETAETAETAAAGASQAAETAASVSAAEEDPALAQNSPAGAGQEGSLRNIHVHLADIPEDPIPYKMMDTDTASLLKLVSEGLVVLDEENTPVPGCAQSWEVSEDGLEWTFRLREDLCWSDGSDIKASDFVTLMQMVADPAEEALYGQDLMQNIAGYEDVLNGDPSALQVAAKDDRTVVVTLQTPDPDFAKSCASWSLLPLKELIREGDGSAASDWKSITGNGPYLIESVTPGREFVLKKNPYYEKSKKENESLPVFDSVLWTVTGDINQEYSDFLNGEIDAVSAIPGEEQRILETDHLIQKKNLPDTMGICFNCRHEVLSDTRVRRALSIAVDRTFIAETILDDVYMPEGGNGQDEDKDVESHVQEAKELLEEAGYKDGEGFPVLTCIADEDTGAVLIADYLASAWKDLGIEVQVEAVDAEDLAQEKSAGTFDLYCGSIYLASDLPAAELAKFTTDSEDNVSGFSSEEYDLLISEMTEAVEADAYTEVMEDAFDILLEEVPVSPLATRCISWLRKEEYPGIRCDNTGCWELWDIEGEDVDADLSQNAEGSDSADVPENADDTENVESAGASGTGNAPLVVKAAIPAAEPGETQKGDPAVLPQIMSTLQTDDSAARSQSASSLTPTALDLVRSSEFYFEKTNETAYLLRQAWGYDKVSEDAQRVLSIPKYSELNVTGTGNQHYVRVAWDKKTLYVDSNRVTSDKSAIDSAIEQEKAEQAEKELLTASLHSVKESELTDRAADVRARTEEVLEAIARREAIRTQTRNPNWNGPVLSRSKGSVMGPSGKETYYNLNMNGVVNIMRRMGNTDEYWVRDDGCKMLGDYIMCAANLRVHPRGSLVESSLGTCIVCDTGGFASRNSQQLDIAVTW